jgi:pilus assembly protein FimV
VDEFLDNPLALGGLVLVLLLLAGYGWWAWRRKKASQSKFQDSVLGAATGSGGPASVFGATAAATAAAAAPGAAAAPAAPASQPGGMEAEEVDPIAEADVYMAYGRDAQAEEILKEALQKDPKRVPVLAKLLEIYANRRDAKSFEQHALKLKGLTNGAGPEWEKAAALGRSLDAGNGLYAGSGGSAPAAAAAAVVVAAPAAPTLDFDLGGAPAQTNAPDISFDEPAKDPSASSVDFDLGGSTTPAAAPAPQKGDSDFTPEGTLIMGATEAEKTVSGLDFDLSMGGDEKKTAAPSPAAAPAAPAPADSSGGLDFDLNLDLDIPADKSAGGDQSAPAMDLSSISLDLGSAGEPSTSGTSSSDPKWQEVATKLDLAKAYEEMGDKDGARELLNEVMKDGDAAQKGQAQQLLAKLG